MTTSEFRPKPAIDRAREMAERAARHKQDESARRELNPSFLVLISQREWNNAWPGADMVGSAHHGIVQLLKV